MQGEWEEVALPSILTALNEPCQLWSTLSPLCWDLSTPLSWHKAQTHSNPICYTSTFQREGGEGEGGKNPINFIKPSNQEQW